MTATVIRIAGASYSGSTALGYFLNTAPGVVFGSELYRLLPAHVLARPNGVEPELCDCCGADCAIWTPSLRSTLLAHPLTGLADVYDLFFASQPEHKVLVDGSKSLAWYSASPTLRHPLHHLVSVKHPLRLLASWLYNDRNLIPVDDRSTLEDCGRWLRDHPQRVQPLVEAITRRLADQYRALRALAQAAPTWWCRSDDAGDVARTLERIGSELDIEIAPERITSVPCHSIGGNRSLVWQARAFEELPLAPEQNLARWAYYRGLAGGGFLQDNKFELLLTGKLVDSVRAAARRHDLYTVLGYSEAV